MLTLDKIYHASYVLKDVIRQTNIVQARGICDDCDVYLKPENLQITGSFKVRGSGYKISQLTEEERQEVLLPVLQATTLRVLHLPLQSTVSSRLSVCLTVHLFQRLKLLRTTEPRFVWFRVFMMMLITRL